MEPIQQKLLSRVLASLRDLGIKPEWTEAYSVEPRHEQVSPDHPYYQRLKQTCIYEVRKPNRHAFLLDPNKRVRIEQAFAARGLYLFAVDNCDPAAPENIFIELVER